MAVIKDVAKMAGLSVSVVSKYLNYPDTVREDTRTRIEAAIEALDYYPSTAARSMRTKRSKMIAIVVTDIQDEFFAEIFSWMKDSAAKRGYTPILFTSESDDEAMLNYLCRMSIGHFDGIIPCFFDGDDLPRWLLQTRKDFPVVMLDDVSKNSQHPKVAIDLLDCEYKATKHLIDQGYKRIAFIGGEKNAETTIAKYNGFSKALEDANLPIYEQYILYVSKSRYREGYLAAKKLLAMENPPDAVITSNDAVAAGFMKYALTHGVRVPEDVGIVGFDNIPMAAIYEPGISTVSVPVKEMCCATVDLLIDKIEGQLEDSPSIIFESKLIPRGSSDKRKTKSGKNIDLFTD